MARPSNKPLDSTVSFRNSQGISVSGTLMGVTRQSVSLEVYNPYSVAQMSEMLSELTIRRQGRVVYHGAAVVTTLVNTGIYLVLSATLTDAWKDLTDLTGDKDGVRQEVDRFLVDLDAYKGIRPKFQVAISRLRTQLSELSRWLEQVDVDNVLRTQQDSDAEEYIEEIIQQVKRPVLPRLKENMAEFEYEASLVNSELVGVHRAFSQRDLHPLILRSPFMHRTFTKPLGYAGDYEMVNMMLRNPHEGPNTYFKVINSLFLSEGPAVAHRNRVDILLDRLEKQVDDAVANKKKIHIFNLGCGPAIELQRLLTTRKMTEQIEITLVDFSTPTLNYTQGELQRIMAETGSYPKINFIHNSVDQILRQSAKLGKQQRENYDYIYCAGLFDYFSQKACSRVLKLFYQLVKPGGTVLSTNVHSDNPALAVMEYLMEWHLIYRNEKDMVDLISSEYQHRVYCDDSGVNVFLEYDKPLTGDA